MRSPFVIPRNETGASRERVVRSWGGERRGIPTLRKCTTCSFRAPWLSETGVPSNPGFALMGWEESSAAHDGMRVRIHHDKPARRAEFLLARVRKPRVVEQRRSNSLLPQASA